MSLDQALLETRPYATHQKSCAVLRLPQPFSVDKVQVESFEALTKAANTFLELIATTSTFTESFKPHASWLNELKLGTGGVRWLPVTWGKQSADSEDADPRNSFWVKTTHRDGSTRNALVMIATTGTEQKGKFVADPFRCAIRVVAHLAAEGDATGTRSLRFTTFTSSLPELDFAGFTKKYAGFGKAGDKALTECIAARGLSNFSLTTSGFSFRNRLGDAPLIHINWTGLQTGLGTGTGTGVGTGPDTGSDNDPQIYDYSVSIPNFDGDLSSAVVERHPRSTHAVDPATAILGKDRASQGKPDAWLKQHPSQRFEYAAAPTVKKSAKKGGSARMPAEPTASMQPAPKIKVSTMFYPSNRGQFAPTASATKLDARTQANAIAVAELQGQALLARIEKTGLRADHYFKCFNLPVKITLNAPITPDARDGLTVNAQVTPGSIGRHAHDPDSKAWLTARPQLRVKFAHADLSAALLDATERTPPQRLSLVTDSRWVWHEFGHVLIAAATGELELPFVHSVGDGLAAIIHDVDSGLRDDTEFRGATFPWVSLPRRHDRCPDRGWCWSGGLHQPSRFWTGTKGGPSYKAYTTEQIMSSTLFSLYQAMGGDDKNVGKRQTASDDAVSLIIVALALLGPSMHVDADSVQHFVAALLDADECLGTDAAKHIIDVFCTKFKMPIST